MKIYLIVLLAIFASCSSPQKKVIHPKDYQSYLKVNEYALVGNNKTIDFWAKRFDSDNLNQTAILKLAGLYAERFKSHGDINDIHLSDSLLNHALEIAVSGKAGIYQGLAANAITQHQFKKANAYLEIALSIGEKKAATYLMLADVRMELGDNGGAKTILKDFKNKNSFSYLIRNTKIKDKEGKLDTAIHYMEKALDRVGDNKVLYSWTKSNLGDMYGHAGRINEAYQSYLDVLKADPSYLYALKGIAWIALAHDNNYDEAKRIIKFIQTRKDEPDLDLYLAEIAEMENDAIAKQQLLSIFESKISNHQYGAMYNKYMALLMADEYNNYEKAIEIATAEVKSRPTTESYDLLAWSLFQSGNKDGAMEIVVNKVEGKTYEPEAIYHMGLIYHGRDASKSKEYLEESLASSFELGPSATAQIRKLLKDI